MASRSEKDKQRLVQDKCQVILGQLLREEDNKYCVDCDAKGPRWASWNLGIFVCIRCAGIHRNLGVHISKVKSVNLDVWTPEQVGCLQQMGNSKARAVYEANLPDNFRRPQTDSSLEAFVRAKYEQKKYIAKEWIPPTSPKPAFDIEEEHRKEKEKKRTRNKNFPNVELPPAQQTAALPRPHSGGATASNNSSANVSPASVGKRDHSIPQGKKDTSNSCADLLGLDINGDENAKAANDDPFDVFMSAQPITQTNSANPANSASEIKPSEFQEISNVEALKKSVLSKESILSLYGNGATQPSLPSQPNFGIPGGVYVPQNSMFCQGGPPIMPVGWPPATVIPGTGIIQDGASTPGMQAPAINQLTNTSVSNPFLSMGLQGGRQQQIAHQQMHLHQQPQVPPFTNTLVTDSNQCNVMTNVPQFPQMANVNLSQVQQQMAAFQINGMGMNTTPQWGVPVAPGVPNPGMVNMPVNGQVAPAWGIRPGQGHTLSTNLWQ